ASGRGWTVWGSLFGMADSQNAYGSSDGWYSTGCGLMGGADKALGDGLAAGFDLALVSDRFEAGVRLGSLATLQYAFTSHPDFEEDGGAEALRIDGGTADSLAFLLGAHLGASKEIGSGCRLDVELMAGWRHELLEGTIRTRAAFAENPSATFTSARRLSTRDAGVLQASLRIAHESGCFAELDLGGEARTAGAGVTGGLRVGFEF
ncbi:MAG: autotransporter outer membrane beta-barrel domain-containing protein, partial [Desulfovibrio sp.]|nr:autotransporter outer membrane beta-barrel domain-containing protein [Desulfovibrio sp.]